MSLSSNLDIFARRLARSFLQHLGDELVKPQPAQQDFDDRSALEINKEIRERILAEYPGLASDPEPPFHLFRRWFEANEFPIAYDDFTTEAYNLLFEGRLRCLHNWSHEARKEYHDLVLEIFGKFDYRREGFSVSNFLKFENNMRELIRTILAEYPEEMEEEIWPVLYDQSVGFQQTVNEFFENILKEAFAESERLLTNILPETISTELKKNGRVKPVSIESATVLFTDFKGFTQLSEQMSPEQLVAELDECFSAFDEIIDRYGLEKIKTIGDSFMCAAGIPSKDPAHVYVAALASLAMQQEIAKLADRARRRGQSYWEVRIGFHTGPLVAGVIGKRKFSYDIWGDTVNTASRMESSGAPGRVNVSAASAQLLRHFFRLEDRGLVDAKNKAPMRMFFLNGLKPRYAEQGDVAPGAVHKSDGPGESGAGNAEPGANFLKIIEGLRAGKKLRFASAESATQPAP